jgi:hypothetical protein
MKRHTISTLLLIAGCLAPIPVRAQARTATPAEGLSIDRAAWVAGCWRMEDGTRQMEEQWMAPAGGVMRDRQLLPGVPARDQAAAGNRLKP